WDHGAEPLAGGARRGRHDLAEEGPGHPLDVATAVADLAGLEVGARPAAVAAAGVAHHGRVDLQLALGAERRLGEVDVHADEGVLAAAGARHGPGGGAAAAEERLEDVLEPEAVAEPGTGAARRRARVH